MPQTLQPSKEQTLLISYNQTEGTLFGEFTIKDVATSSAAIVNINQEPGASYAHSIMFVEIGIKMLDTLVGHLKTVVVKV